MHDDVTRAFHRVRDVHALDHVGRAALDLVDVVEREPRRHLKRAQQLRGELFALFGREGQGFGEEAGRRHQESIPQRPDRVLSSNERAVLVAYFKGRYLLSRRSSSGPTYRARRACARRRW